MIPIVLALVASVGWGISDFLGGLAARNASLAAVLFGSQVVGLLLVCSAVSLVGTTMPKDPRLLLGLVAGAVAVAELGLIYTALRRGPAVVMAPIAALSALLPVVVGIAGGDHVDLLIGVGLGCALSGALGASWTPARQRPHRREALIGAAVAGGAAVGAGTVLTLIDAASKADPLWAVVSLRVGGALAATVLIVIGRVARGDCPRRPRRAADARKTGGARGVAFTIAAIGLTDAGADAGFASATRGGALSVVSVLASLYPLTTIALGVCILGERPAWMQLAGAALAVLGIAILAATCSSAA